MVLLKFRLAIFHLMMPFYIIHVVMCMFVSGSLSIEKSQHRLRRTIHGSLKTAHTVYHTEAISELEKRSISISARSLAALKTLLSGATSNTPATGNVKVYLKLGSASTAIRDFYAVKPRNVKKMNRAFLFGSNAPQGEVLMANVGNLRLRLMVDGTRQEGFPVLEVHSFKPGYLGHTDKIIYKPLDDYKKALDQS